MTKKRTPKRPAYLPDSEPKDLTRAELWAKIVELRIRNTDLQRMRSEQTDRACKAEEAARAKGHEVARLEGILRDERNLAGTMMDERDKLKAELEQVHGLLDTLYGCPPRRPSTIPPFTDPQPSLPLTTRLAAWALTNAVRP